MTTTTIRTPSVEARIAELSLYLVSELDTRYIENGDPAGTINRIKTLECSVPETPDNYAHKARNLTQWMVELVKRTERTRELIHGTQTTPTIRRHWIGRIVRSYYDGEWVARTAFPDVGENIVRMMLDTGVVVWDD